MNPVLDIHTQVNLRLILNSYIQVSVLLGQQLIFNREPKGHFPTEVAQYPQPESLHGPPALKASQFHN